MSLLLDRAWNSLATHSRVTSPRRSGSLTARAIKSFVSQTDQDSLTPKVYRTPTRHFSSTPRMYGSTTLLRGLWVADLVVPTPEGARISGLQTLGSGPPGPRRGGFLGPSEPGRREDR